MTHLQDITRILGDRFKVGRPYKNASLEAKRLRAIQWLRTESGKGWVCDQVKRMVKYESTSVLL